MANYVKLYDHQNEVMHTTQMTLTAIKDLLPPNFKKVQRSFIVNTDYIVKDFREGKKRFLLLTSKAIIPVSDKGEI